MSLEKAVSSAYAAGCRLVFASGVELAATEDMRVFRCADAHTAVYAALGASLAGRRALVALGEAVELPDSRVTGRRRRAHARRGRELCQPARGLRRLRERRRRRRPCPGRGLRRRGRFSGDGEVPQAARALCPGERAGGDVPRLPVQGRVLRRGQALAAHDRRRRLLAARRKAAFPGAGRRLGPGHRRRGPRGLHRRAARVRARHRRRHGRRGAHGGRPAPPGRDGRHASHSRREKGRGRPRRALPPLRPRARGARRKRRKRHRSRAQGGEHRRAGRDSPRRVRAAPSWRRGPDV